MEKIKKPSFPKNNPNIKIAQSNRSLGCNRQAGGKNKKIKKNKTMFNKKIVSCEECGCLLFQKDAQGVKYKWGKNRYFCGNHKKPYSRVDGPWRDNVEGWKGWDGRFKFYREVEVDRDGIPAGYIPAPRKNPSQSSGQVICPVPHCRKKLKNNLSLGPHSKAHSRADRIRYFKNGGQH